MELIGGIDQTTYEAEVLTLDSETTTTSEPYIGEQGLTGDVVLRFGTGRGFELGASLVGAHLKYSVLDERRHANTPLSAALSVQAGYRYAGAGMLLSKQIDRGGFHLRPVANVWFQWHSAEHVWGLPPSAVDPDLEVVNPGADDFYDDAGIRDYAFGMVDVVEVAVPLGVEVPIPVNDTWDVVPFAAYAFSIPTSVYDYGMYCTDCLAGVESVELQRRSFIWAGVKLQPGLRRPGAVSPSTPDVEEAP